MTSKKTRDFFAGNNFYTTAANRMASGTVSRGSYWKGCGSMLDWIRIRPVSWMSSLAKKRIHRMHCRIRRTRKLNLFTYRKGEASDELEEYTLPSDGMIIRQMNRQRKVSRRTWFAFAVMLIVVPILLFFSVKIWGGRKIPALQPDRGSGCYASLFHDV
ncbi:MAG: hypothetical protein ACLUTU_06415 [Blautia faecis]